MLPRVKILFENGNLGLVTPSPDGLMGICCTGTSVGSTFELSKAYKISAYSDLQDLGITAVNNPTIDKIIKEFYDEAQTGTEVWLMAFPDTVKMSEMADKNENYAKKLIEATGGKLRGIFISRTPSVGYTPTITNGLDADVATAIAKAQLLAQWATEVKFAPLFVVIEGYGYSGVSADLTDLTAGTSNNRVSVMIGDSVSNSKNAAIGVLAGRIASIPVQRNIARVKSGAVALVAAYIKDKVVDVADVTGLHDKGYITFRTFVGRAGYFFNDDFMATKATDDYSHLTARRTIDKAYRISYNTLLEELLDEVPVNADGTLQVSLVKSWQAKVESAIASAMTANGELSADVTNPSDKGVICYIDHNQNIIADSKVNVRVSVRPFGYPRYIDVYLGFQTMTSN